MSRPPGTIRDSILDYLANHGRDASISEIITAVEADLGSTPTSSVRSYLNLNVGDVFERTARGRYKLVEIGEDNSNFKRIRPAFQSKLATFYLADCFSWLNQQEENSVHAVVTDPPYSMIEYSDKEIAKLRGGRGGVWRIPPSFDGNRRSPLPRFTVLNKQDRIELFLFFKKFGSLVQKIIVPGGNIIIASNPLLSHIVASAMTEAGLEHRGYLVRLTMTMRGGDRPKNAHKEFSEVSVMPRSQWEPWVLLRRPLDGRVQDNLRKWGTGGFRRISDQQPFGDVIPSRPTTRKEKSIAPHPSLKPQAFLRKIVRASLPLGNGVILDPFAGSGSTLAAANYVGYRSIGIDSDANYAQMALNAIPKLESIV